jgi:hypothetical protein
MSGWWTGALRMTARHCALRWIAGLTFLLATATTQAFVEADNDNASIEAIGSIDLIGAYLHYPEVNNDLGEDIFGDDDGLGSGVFRILLDGNIYDVDYELNFYNDLSRVPISFTKGSFDTVSSFYSPYRTSYLSWTYWEDGPVTGQLGLDSISIHYEKSPIALTVGRFPVNYSVTNLYAPNDFFVPYSASAVSTVYKPGVDAIRLGVATSPFAGFEFVGVLGTNSDDNVTWNESALLLRAHMVRLNTEWALLGGKLAERWIVGASIQGEAGPIGIRTEGHVGFPDRDGDGVLDEDDEDDASTAGIYGRVAFGLEVLFPWHNTMLELEYAFYSDGESDPEKYPERYLTLFPDDQPYLAQHYLGFVFALDIIPILRTSTLVQFNAQDYSGLVSSMLVYNVADEADFIAGILVPWGERPTVEDPDTIAIQSEFGSMALTVFLETRFYF